MTLDEPGDEGLVHVQFPVDHLGEALAGHAVAQLIEVAARATEGDVGGRAAGNGQADLVLPLGMAPTEFAHGVHQIFDALTLIDVAEVQQLDGRRGGQGHERQGQHAMRNDRDGVGRAAHASGQGLAPGAGEGDHAVQATNQLPLTPQGVRVTQHGRHLGDPRGQQRHTINGPPDRTDRSPHDALRIVNRGRQCRTLGQLSQGRHQEELALAPTTQLGMDGVDARPLALGHPGSGLVQAGRQRLALERADHLDPGTTGRTHPVGGVIGNARALRRQRRQQDHSHAAPQRCRKRITWAGTS